MLKGYRKLDRYLTDWCNQNGFKVKCRLSSDFLYDKEKNIIYYALAISETSNDIFNDMFSDYIPNVKSSDPFILSFFHELGHCITKDEFTDYEWCDYYDFVKSFSSKIKVTKRDYKKYYMHPIELSATLWACDYINNNCEKIKNFSTGFSELVLNFFSINNIKDE